MFRSLHMKLVLILILLIVSVMAVMGTFLINSVGNYYLKDFHDQVTGLFTSEMLVSLNEAAQNDDDGQQLAAIIAARTGSLESIATVTITFWTQRAIT